MKKGPYFVEKDEEINMKTIALSKYIGVDRHILEEIGVFDSTLGIDTKLFIDPKLLVGSDIPEFKNARENILNYFRKLLRWHRLSHRSARLQDKVRSMLAVPEPLGLSIGYGNKTDKGTAIPETLANAILHSASELLSIGVDEPEIIEVLALFVKNFGPDRLSDLTTSITYSDFCNYSVRISKDLKLHTETFHLNGSKYQLPKHPFLKDAPIIFIPKDLLRPLPLATSWDEIASAAEQNESLRDDFNQIIFPVLTEQVASVSKASKKEKDQLKKDFDALLHIYRAVEADPYNLLRDDKGYYAVQPFVDGIAAGLGRIQQPTNKASLLEAVRVLLQQYQRALEDSGGNKLLYKRGDNGALDTKRPHHEDVAQIIFYLLADQFCQAANIALAREADAGLGPVDFWVATAYDSKILVEIKKSSNKSLVDGFDKQVQAYEKSENAFHSFYVVILVKSRKQDKHGDHNDQLSQVERRYENRKKNRQFTPELVVIDGTVHASPSKL